MPLYDYKCPACEHRFEKLRPSERRDDALECPKCKTIVVRQVTAAAIELKGNGWAKDGYAG